MTRGGAATKSKRQQTILSLVSRERLGSQEEIRARLVALGLPATQSTISRDVEELGLARVHDHGGVRYVVPGEGVSSRRRRTCSGTRCSSSRCRSRAAPASSS